MALAADEKEDTGTKAEDNLDPICDRSLAPHFIVASCLLLLTVILSISNEVWLRRPYKGYQAEFVALARDKGRAEREKAVGELGQQKSGDAYKEASARVKREADAFAAKEGELKAKKALFDKLTGELNDVRGEFQEARGEYQPLVYEYDHARLENRPKDAEKLAKEIKDKEPGINAIFVKMRRLGDDKKRLQAEMDDLRAPLSAAEKALADAVPAKKALDEVDKRLQALDGVAVAELKPYQIYNSSLGVVDRCGACHLAADKPGYAKESWDALKGKVPDRKLAESKGVYSTHPGYLSSDPAEFDALSIHNVNRFGCTSCHWGNGPATTSAEKAHALEGEPAKSWEAPMEFQLMPMLPMGSLEAVRKGEQHFGNMMEASCEKCHLTEVKLTGGPQVSYGRQLVEDLGCWGCHKIKGFEATELEAQALDEKLAKDLPARRRELEAAMAKDDALKLRHDLTEVVHETEVAVARRAELEKEIKFIGPDLNRTGAGALKDKLYFAWLPRWIHDPQAFRPGTWMPNPLLADEEVLETAAYIWQQASGTPTDTMEPAAPDDPKLVAQGRMLVEERGCLACHTLEDQGRAPAVEPLRAKVTSVTAAGKTEMVPSSGERFEVNDVEGFWKDPKKAPIADNGREDLLKKGTRFAPSLARVGEKIRYEWLVRWVLDPKSVQPHTRMPKLRLGEDEARAIATFLTTLRKEPPGGERWKDLTRAKLEDPKLAARGFRHVKRYGCFNCHAIDLREPPAGAGEVPPMSAWSPISNPGKIGAELSSHGSKPLAQFDFGFLDVPETRNVWLETKILEPRVWDRGKYKGDPEDRLRMPRFGLNAAEAAGVTTVLVGLTDNVVPEDYVYHPDQRKAAIIEGERLVRKFNCRSCHVIDGEGQWAKDELTKNIMHALKFDADQADQAERYLPPVLTGEGHRAQPEWLFKFFKNPGAYQPLRPWHTIRMPTFDMSDAEATSLVKYFDALENERFPYPLEEPADAPQLLVEGRAAFKKDECNTCHRVGDFIPPGKKLAEQAPNLAYALERLRPSWMERFIPDPQAYSATVNMPSFQDFGAKPFQLQSPENQRTIRALVAYIRSLADPAVRSRDGWVEGPK